MKPLRDHVVLAIDGGGLRGIICSKALTILEQYLIQTYGKNLYQLVDVAAGTSTGSIITAALMIGKSAKEILDLYLRCGTHLFKKSKRTLPVIKYLMSYRYDNESLRQLLDEQFGSITMDEIWEPNNPSKIPHKILVIIIRDLVEARTRFLKSYKDDARDWTLVKAILGSTAVPTIFPVLDGRYVDGGVGSFSNPCLIAAFEAVICQGWNPRDVTLISLGTGHEKGGLRAYEANKFSSIEWIPVILDSFMSDANVQQVRSVSSFLSRDLDFRRFQVGFPPEETAPSVFEMKDSEKLLHYGEIMGDAILNDHWEELEFDIERPPKK